MVLGSFCPLVFRPLPDGRFQLVGTSFVYGLHDAIPLLGPLPPGWRVVLNPNNLNHERYICHFVNERGDVQAEDPRLEPHPDWARVELKDLGRDLNGDDPEFCSFFRHNITGELIDYDPRMSPEALKARGVQLTNFALV